MGTPTLFTWRFSVLNCGMGRLCRFSGDMGGGARVRILRNTRTIIAWFSVLWFVLGGGVFWWRVGGGSIDASTRVRLTLRNMWGPELPKTKTTS